jgi:hypothetical protein
MIQAKKDVTPFGTVTSERLIYNVRRWGFCNELQEDVPLRDVISVKLEIKRYPVFAVSLLLIASVCRVADSVGILIAIIPLAFAILLLWGFPLIRVSTAEVDLPPAVGLPWTRPEAEWFVTAVDRQRRSCLSPRLP